MQIICLNEKQDLYGVYSVDGRRGPYGTPLLFKGTLDEVLKWKGNIK